MPKIPQDVDYGARPSLRSSRIDLPGAGETATGEALSRASEAFTQIYAQQKAKDDRLNYSLAKNELLTADISEREKLKDDEDYASYDERYSTGYNTARDDIYSRYNLSPGDARLLDAESNLIRERGRVQVGDAARVTKVDNEKARIKANLIEAAEQVLNEDAAIANDIMLTQLENIKAGEELGVYTDLESLAESQKFVQNTAHARLVGMDVQDRIAELELSLAHRKARGAISIEDLEAGKGSGSIADFLNRDVVAEMLRKAKDEDQLSTMQGEVFGIIDRVIADFPETDARSLAQRKKAARAMLKKNDPDYGAKRNFLEQELSQRNAEDKAIKDLSVYEIELSLMDQIREGKSFGELYAGDISLLRPQQQKFIEDFANNWQDNEGFADATNADMQYAWHHFTPKQVLNAQINGAEWRTQFTREDWNRMIELQRVYRDAAAKGKDPNIYRGDPDDEVLKNMLVGGSNAIFEKVPSPGTDDYDRYLRIDGAVNQALIDASLAKYAESGSGYLLPQEVRDITAQTIGQMVFIDDAFWNTEMHLAGLTEAERKSGDIYVNIDEIRSLKAPDDSLGQPQNMEQFLRNFAGARGPGLSERVIEKAYFLWITGDNAGAEALLTD